MMQRSIFSVIAINSRSVYEGLLVAAVQAHNLLTIYQLEGFSYGIARDPRQYDLGQQGSTVQRDTYRIRFEDDKHGGYSESLAS